MTSRHAIFCPVHAVGVVVDGSDRYRCQYAGHYLARWWVVDVRAQRVLDEVSEDHGVVRELQQPLATCPRLALGDVLTEKEKKSMPRGIPGSGPHGDPTKAAQQPKPKQRGKSCLASTKFTIAGRVLWLRLVRSDVKDDSTRYRLKWELIDEKERAETGVAQAFADEGDARKEYSLAVKKAEQDGWVPASGGHLVLKPVPAPAVKVRKAS